MPESICCTVCGTYISTLKDHYFYVHTDSIEGYICEDCHSYVFPVKEEDL